MEVSLGDSIIPNPDKYHPSLSIDFVVRNYRQHPHKDNLNIAPSSLNYSRADLGVVYMEIANIDWTSIYACKTASEVLNFFENSLMDIITTVPKCKNIVIKYSLWYTPDIKKIICQKESFCQKWKITKNKLYYSKFSDLRKIAKRMIRTAYNAYHQKLENEIKNEAHLFWKYIKAQVWSYSTPHTLRHENEDITDSKTRLSVSGHGRLM